MKFWPFKVTNDSANKPVIAVNYKGVEKRFSPEELSSMILIKMKEISEYYLGKKIKDAKAGVKTAATITNDKGRLTKNEIERMIQEAEIYRAEDEEFRKKIKAMNKYEDYVYNMRSVVRAVCNLNASTKKNAENVIKEAIQWVDANRRAEVEEYNSRMRKLKAFFSSVIPSNAGIRIEEVD
ncbi:hypothetical protein DCAR_0100447 [Daucus carota subsp. sativus]|uniref:Heat shock protein 70 n=1 Tax=Daucus carota subsp. sativus TaxID=79200 RepID=A0AAF1AIA9_DAUCS|nr:hypothetical protein DCAR_0100447 [Daucus carota subsp. sativus]